MTLCSQHLRIWKLGEVPWIYLLCSTDANARRVGADMADQELFAPSPNDYPELLAYDLTEEPSSNHSHVKDYRDTPVWRQLDKVKADIEHWQFVMEYDDVPDIIWDLWKMHKYQGTVQDFQEILEDAIKDGERLIQRLMGITEVANHEGLETMDLKDFITEISLLMFQVHRAIASILVRLDFSRGWQVKKYPKVLCPRDWDM